jgi:hypothetical protein
MKLLRKMNFKKVICLFLFLTSWGILDAQYLYNIEIKYSESRKIYTFTKLMEDKEELSKYIHLFFETGFNQDDIELTVNDTSVTNINITTDESLGLAKYIRLGKINEIDNFSLRINNGAIVHVELIRKDNVIGVFLNENTLIVEFIEGYPSYY